MLGICRFYDIRPWIEQQWKHCITIHNIERHWCIGCPSYERTDKHTVYISDIKELPQNSEIVLLSPKNAKYIPGINNVVDFIHPGQDAVYMFGPDRDFLTAKMFEHRQPDHYVYIASEERELFSFTAATVTLYERKHRPNYQNWLGYLG
jgi:hypothetical protein